MEMTVSEAIRHALVEALDSGEPMALLGQDIGPHGGVFGVTQGLWERFGENVVREGPLCESSTVGFAIGLAISGVRAVVELEVMDFVGVAMDQVFNQAAKLHYFTGGKLTVPLVIRAPIAARIGMGCQHSQSLESWFMHIPGLKVVMPSNAADAYGLLRSALRESNLVLFLDTARLYGQRMDVDLEAAPIAFGQAKIARAGSDVTVVALGGMVDEALKAAAVLAGQGVEVEVIDPRTLAPLDIDTIIESLSRTQRVIVTHDGHKTAGAGAEIAALCMERGFDYLDAPVERVAALDVPIPSGPLLSAVYPDADSVADAVRRLVA